MLDGKPGPVNPDSKGCGTVMRSAPFGLVNRDHVAFSMAARAAQCLSPATGDPSDQGRSSTSVAG